MSVGVMSAKEILNDFTENYTKVRKLLNEDSKNNHNLRNEPHLPKHKAKNILNNMSDSLKQIIASRSDIEGCSLYAMLGWVLLNIGVIEMETGDPIACEKVLKEAVDILSPNASKPEIVITLINVYNNLSVLCLNRREPEKAKILLNKAKTLYENFKSTLQIPLPIEHIINTGENVTDDIVFLEKAFTITLYYLAQVFGFLEDTLKYAIYSHVNLKRQLQYKDYQPIGWAMNSAILSQFFADQNGFYQSRNHLAASSTILDQYEETLRATEDGNETHLNELKLIKRTSAHVAKYWTKYCIKLMSSSKMRLENELERSADLITDMSNLTIQHDDNVFDGNIKNLVFTDLDVSKYEKKITDKYLLTYQDAREVFLSYQSWSNKVKEHCKPGESPSDNMELVQDSSQAYSYLAFFEEDDERKAKMQKRRIDILEGLIKGLHPLYCLEDCRQLWFELGEVYTNILDIKLKKFHSSKEKQTPHALKKINMLCKKSIENYDCFLNSIKDKNGIMPIKLEHDLISPIISAYAFIGRNNMKSIAFDKSEQLINMQKSYEAYQAVVDICKHNKEGMFMMQEEYNLSKEMAKVLPIKIKKLQTNIVG